MFLIIYSITLRKLIEKRCQKSIIDKGFYGASTSMTTENKVLLYCCQWTRHAALTTHKAYTDGFHDRLMPTFDSIDKEADRASQEYWDKAMSEPAYDYEYRDAGDFADDAISAGIEVYENLTFVREQLIQLSIAGLYHLWERTLKQFIIKELKNYQYEDSVYEKIEKENFDSLIKTLKQFDYDLEKKPYHKKMRELLLVANVVKHGTGKAFKDLIKAAPHLFEKPKFDVEREPRLDDLKLSPKDFMVYSYAIKEFWMLLPERMYLKVAR